MVAAAGDPLWGDLRLDPCDVFAVELKKKVLEEPVFRLVWAWHGGSRAFLFVAGGRHSNPERSRMGKNPRIYKGSEATRVTR